VAGVFASKGEVECKLNPSHASQAEEKKREKRRWRKNKNTILNFKFAKGDMRVFLRGAHTSEKKNKRDYRVGISASGRGGEGDPPFDYVTAWGRKKREEVGRDVGSC